MVLLLIDCAELNSHDEGFSFDVVVETVQELFQSASVALNLSPDTFYLQTLGGSRKFEEFKDREENDLHTLPDGTILQVKLLICGGLDFQHREGGKTGTGGQLSEAQAALERKERLRKLALETIDITKDPYFLRNHLGTFECKLCLTLHPNEGNYLAHTQGKRHQYNLGRRAAMEAKNATPQLVVKQEAPAKRVIKIGRPGYKVTKSRDLATRQRAIAFEIDYPEAEEDSQPRHRFMSAFEQKIEPPDKNYQYVLFACDPYETIAFKIPNQPIDKREGRFFTNWDKSSKKFVLQLHFVDGALNVNNNNNNNMSNHTATLNSAYASTAAAY